MVSVLGFGCMRFPVNVVNGKQTTDEEYTVKMLLRAYELGINYFDTAYFYCDGMSEVVLGKAVHDFRRNIYLSTKCHSRYMHKRGDLRRLLEEQLNKLQTDYIDFYHLHGIRFSTLVETDKKVMWIGDLQKAKEEGLIRHIAFSTHDTPDNTIRIIDTGIFETMLCQYNLIDRQNEWPIKVAAGKGIGIAVMGPLGGGRITELPDNLPGNEKNNVAAALRFVMSNKDVSCILSGMSLISQLEENVLTVSGREALSSREIREINNLMEQKKNLSDLYCTGCGYCMPCPIGVDIPEIFKAANYARIYGVSDYARKKYTAIGIENKGKRADSCIECGVCENKCPQGLKIRKQLIQSHKLLSSDN